MPAEEEYIYLCTRGGQQGTMYIDKKKPTMKNTTTTFQVQFFDGRTAEWKEVPTGIRLTTLEDAKIFKNAQIEMCDGYVDFRIVEWVA